MVIISNNTNVALSTPTPSAIRLLTTAFLLSSMDPLATATAHLHALTSTPSLKALILDPETTRLLSLTISHTTLLSNSVLLIQTLTPAPPPSPNLTSLHAYAILRPTAENIHHLRAELRAPRFASYKLIFTNTLRRSWVEEIADADVDHLVTDVRELFIDYFPLDRRLVSLGVVPCLGGMGTERGLRNPALERTVEGIVSVLLAVKRRPRVRYLRSSELCRAVAERIQVRMDQEGELFTFRVRDEKPLMLVLDRREDPVTPLLNQWTYEAMLHELLGIQYNRIKLGDVPGVPEEFRDLVLDTAEDAFYRENRFCNFGDLGVNLQGLVEKFRVESQSKGKLETIEEMKRFVGNYPEFRRTSSNVGKHVTLAGELSRLVSKMSLLEVSQIEQDLACREAESEHRRLILELLAKKSVNNSDKLRLVMLYSLRYERSKDRGLPLMKEALVKAGLSSDGIHLITAVKEYAGAAKRSSDVFSNRSFFAMASNTVRRGIGGVDNVYTQHEPLLVYTLDDLFRGKLKTLEHPLTRADDDLHVGQSVMGNEETGTAPFITPPRELFVVIAGGVTYEEAKCISAINGDPNAFVPPEGSVTASAVAAARQIRAQVLLIGSTVHNSTSFAVEITSNATAQRAAQLVRPSRFS